MAGSVRHSIDMHAERSRTELCATCRTYAACTEHMHIQRTYSQSCSTEWPAAKSPPYPKAAACAKSCVTQGGELQSRTTTTPPAIAEARGCACTGPSTAPWKELGAHQIPRRYQRSPVRPCWSLRRRYSALLYYAAAALSLIRESLSSEVYTAYVEGDVKCWAVI